MDKLVSFWEVNISFVVRKGSHDAESKSRLLSCIKNGIGGSDMNCIDVEDLVISLR